MNPVQIDVFDFFSGCGGTSIGLNRAGMNIKVAIDFDYDATQTFSLNLPNATVFNIDIKDLSTEALRPHISGSPILFVACAPCQPFSQIGRNRNYKDTRVNLLLEFLRFVDCYRPEYLLIENVPGLQKQTHDSPLKEFMTHIELLGYKHDWSILDSSNFGVPQKRRRLILVASRLGHISLPCGDESQKRTVRDAISHLPPLKAGESSSIDPLHKASSLSEKNLKRISSLPPGGTRLLWPEELGLTCHENYRGHSDVYGRMDWEQPANTLTTKCNSLSNGKFGHPDQDRAMSLREAALLQSFPEDFKAIGNIKSLAKQIGNAVPPLLAETLGITFSKHYEVYLQNRKSN